MGCGTSRKKKENNNNNMSIDVAIPGDTDRNVIKKEGQKILKYKQLIIEI